ncbi:hypothetical protein L204_102924 [Cryptococcus depauperatus]
MSRKIDLSKFAGSDSEGEDVPPKRQLELSALKSKTFSHGITKKTKRDLEREAEERKRKEEEEAAARVMAEYERAFEGPADPSSSSHDQSSIRTFRGKHMGPIGGFVRAGGAPMAPAAFQKPASTSFQKEPPRGPASMGYSRSQPPVTKASSPPLTGPKPKGKRAMDSFLEEIKSNQNAREQRLGQLAKKEGSSVSALAAWESNSSGGVLDMETTNLFISNLPSQNLTEESLGIHFARLGPVGTVKIMWPRGDEGHTPQFRRGMSGFVSYMNRKDAERAVRELDGSDFLGNTLKVGWSKAVQKPKQALYDVTSKKKRGRSRSRNRSHDRRSRSFSSSQSPPRKKSHHLRSYSSDSYSSLSPSPRRKSDKEKWLNSIPSEQRNFIETVAKKVKQHGKSFEDILKEKEKENSKFSFLFNESIPDYHLYRSLISSSYRIPHPPFDDDGYASLYSSDSAEESEKERTSKGHLGKLARKRFEAMLRGISGKRGEIARSMEFALLRAEAADEIADLICKSLTIDSTPVPRKIARLHLISDILHNSASPLPNVWRYRPAFEHRLPPILSHLHIVYQSLLAYKGKISADVFRTQIENVLAVWERWIIFTSDTAELFRSLLMGIKALTQLKKTAQGNWVEKQNVEEEGKNEKMKESKDQEGKGFKTSGFKSSFKPIAVGEHGAPQDFKVNCGPTSAQTTAIDLRGESTEDLDGEMMEDIDGEVMEDLDGEAMEDIDGEEM